MNDDRNLERLFAEIRQDAQGRTPSYERVRQGRSDVALRRPRRGWLLTFGVVGALAVVAVAIRRSSSAARETEAMVLAQQISGWHSPTDFLLPHSEVASLSSIPRIGEVTRWYPLDEATTSVPSGRKENDSL